jgi:hypothetical protein
MTEILLQLLLRIHFPYKEVDLNRRYDWATIETLKENVAVLGEVRLPWQQRWLAYLVFERPISIFLSTFSRAMSVSTYTISS